MRALIYISILCASLFACSKENSKEHEHSAEVKSSQKYTCPMHPQVIRDAPGQCPICGMELVPVNKGDANSNDLMLNESQIKLANITTQKVSMQSIGETVTVNARLVANEDKTEVISSRAAGRIEKLFVKETGRTIQKGEPLYELYSETLLTLQKEYLLAKQQYETLGATEKRFESFLKAARGKLVLYGLSQDQINQLSETKNAQTKITFLAPASGVVTEISVAEGQYVGEGSSLLKLEDISSLWLEAELYPSETSFAKVDDKINVTVAGFENTPIEAKVIFLSPEYRSNTQITVIRAVIDNKSMSLKPGMQAQVLFTHSSKQSIAVPVDAVIRDGESTHVYVKNGHNVFKPRMVKTGLEDFNKVEIIEGLTELDTVVVSGAYLLYSEIVLKKGGNPMAGHNHGEMQMTSQTTSVKESEIEEAPVSVNPKFSQQLATVLPQYLEVKDALVASNAATASENTLKLAAALKQVDMSLLKGDAHNKWMTNLNIMEEALKSIKNSKDIEMQRVAFSQFSDALYNSIKTFTVTGINVYYQFCPMASDNKGAYWISREEQISNPYFGEQMLRCGETKETLN